MSARSSLVLTSISDLHEKKILYTRNLIQNAIIIRDILAVFITPNNCKSYDKGLTDSYAWHLDGMAQTCLALHAHPAIRCRVGVQLREILRDPSHSHSLLGRNRESSYIRSIRVRSSKKLHYPQRWIITRFELRSPLASHPTYP